MLPVRVSLMIGRQDGVTWDKRVALARAAEDAGATALVRMCSYLFPPDRQQMAVEPIQRNWPSCT
jgi:dihydrodipicolinate synthase/N-acetylneuraminate lyase